jgi:hypothetical protein
MPQIAYLIFIATGSFFSVYGAKPRFLPILFIGTVIA